MNSFDHYNTVFFDCDGVIFDTNKMKSDAFFQSVLSYGRTEALQFQNYHIQNGGISRFVKFAHFFENILNRQPNIGEIENLSHKFSAIVRDKIASSNYRECIFDLRKRNKHQDWIVVSGSNYTELRWLFSKKNLSGLFHGNIYGSPFDKYEIIQKYMQTASFREPALMIGDSAYDLEVSQYFKFDFLFVYEWSDWPRWNNDSRLLHQKILRSLNCLCY